MSTSFEWIEPERLPLDRLKLLIEIYEAVSNRPAVLEGRLAQLWVEFDRRTQKAA
jgi:hypothetical protein